MSEVRAATRDDAEALTAVHLASWRETYAGLLSEAFLAGFDVEDKTAMWRRVCERHPGYVHVGLVDGVVVGFSAAREHEGPPRPLQLVTLYVLSAHHGGGLGQRLLDAALGDAPAFLWAAEANPRAMAFYSRNRFRPDGTRQPLEDWEGLMVVRMVR